MLKTKTEQVWNFLKDQPSLTGFILLGGSALSLRLQHRYSEDLDLACPDVRLPRTALDVLRRQAEEAGIAMQPHDDPGA